MSIVDEYLRYIREHTNQQLSEVDKRQAIEQWQIAMGDVYSQFLNGTQGGVRETYVMGCNMFCTWVTSPPQLHSRPPHPEKLEEFFSMLNVLPAHDAQVRAQLLLGMWGDRFEKTLGGRYAAYLLSHWAAPDFWQPDIASRLAHKAFRDYILAYRYFEDPADIAQAFVLMNTAVGIDIIHILENGGCFLYAFNAAPAGQCE